MKKWLYKDLTDKIIGAAIELHKVLGPGLLESAYEECLVLELTGCRVGLLINFNEKLLSDGVMSRIV